MASGFVLPEYRRQGISANYEQFGFQKVDSKQLPRDFYNEYRIGRIITTLVSIFSKDQVRNIPMKRE